MNNFIVNNNKIKNKKKRKEIHPSLTPGAELRASHIELRPDLTYEEELVKILAREVKELRKK